MFDACHMRGESSFLLYAFATSEYSSLAPLRLPFMAYSLSAQLISSSRVVGRVISALRAGPAWEKTLLFVAYDDAGKLVPRLRACTT
eukprot:4603109-Pleurochrysis_carterae.AAC.2